MITYRAIHSVRWPVTMVTPGHCLSKSMRKFHLLTATEDYRNMSPTVKWGGSRLKKPVRESNDVGFWIRVKTWKEGNCAEDLVSRVRENGCHHILVHLTIFPLLRKDKYGDITKLQRQGYTLQSDVTSGFCSMRTEFTYSFKEFLVLLGVWRKHRVKKGRKRKG